MKNIIVVALITLIIGATTLYRHGENHEPKDYKTIIITVKKGQTLWDIADEFYQQNPYNYNSFSEYYYQIMMENKHLQNKNRLLQIGDKIKIKIKRNTEKQ